MSQSPLYKEQGSSLGAGRFLSRKRLAILATGVVVFALLGTFLGQSFLGAAAGAPQNQNPLTLAHAPNRIVGGLGLPSGNNSKSAQPALPTVTAAPTATAKAQPTVTPGTGPASMAKADPAKTTQANRATNTPKATGPNTSVPGSVIVPATPTVSDATVDPTDPPVPTATDVPTATSAPTVTPVPVKPVAPQKPVAPAPPTATPVPTEVPPTLATEANPDPTATSVPPTATPTQAPEKTPKPKPTEKPKPTATADQQNNDNGNGHGKKGDKGGKKGHSIFDDILIGLMSFF